MKKFFLLIALIPGLFVPSHAQWKQTGEGLLKAIRQGEGAILLASRPAQTLDKSFIKGLSSSFRLEWRQTTSQLRVAQTQWEVNRNLTKSLNLGVPAGATSDVVSQSLQRQEDLAKLQENLNQLLYRWGQLLDDTHSLGYTQLAHVNDHGPTTATLSINGQTALIQDTPGRGLTIYPDEIKTNAEVIEALVKVHEHSPEILSQDKPENIAGWFYLQSNFTNSLKEFQAAQEAYNTLGKRHGLFSGLQNRYARHTNAGLFILRNYNYAAANLALNSAKTLQFISTHQNLFPNAMTSYKQIMQLHNQNSGTPQNFQNFWNHALIPAL